MGLGSYFKNKFRNKAEKMQREIVDTLQARDETELLVILGSELGEMAKKRESNVSKISMEELSQHISYLHVPIFSSARNAIAHLDDTGEKLVRDYADNYIKYKPDPQEIHKLALSGGGGKGAVYAGAIMGLENTGVMSQVDTIAGASAGAITALAVSLGYKSNELEDIVQKNDFNKFFYNATSGVRGIAKIGAWFSDIFSEGDTLTRLQKMNNGNKAMTMVMENVASKLDSIIFSDPDLDREFGEFLELASVKKIKSTLDQSREESDLLLQRVLDKDLYQRLFDKEVHSYQSSRLDNRARGEIWQHSIGNDYLGDRIRDFEDKLWNTDSIREIVSQTRHDIIKETGKDYFNSDREILNSAVKMRRGQHQIEEFFGTLIENKLQGLHDKIGDEKIALIDPRLLTKEGKREASLQNLNDIADEYPELGFKGLEIAVTKGRNLRSLFKGEGVIIDTAKHLTALDPAKHLARQSMSIPFVFNTVRTDWGDFVDGGVRNNLPTQHWDKDSPDGFDKSVLAMITVTAKEAAENDGFQHIFGEKMRKMNTTYREMGIRDAFRTIVLNSGPYDTLDFDFSPEDFTQLNEQSRTKIEGSVLHHDPGIFSKYYNAQLSFLNIKVINLQENPLFESTLINYNEKHKELANLPAFQHVANKTSILDLIDKGREDFNTFESSV